MRIQDISEAFMQHSYGPEQAVLLLHPRGWHHWCEWWTEAFGETHRTTEGSKRGFSFRFFGVLPETSINVEENVVRVLSISKGEYVDISI